MGIGLDPGIHTVQEWDDIHGCTWEGGKRTCPSDTTKTMIGAARDPNRHILVQAPPPPAPDTRPGCYAYGFGLLFGVEDLFKTSARDEAIELTGKGTKSVLESKTFRTAINDYISLWGERLKYATFRAGGKFAVDLAEGVTLGLAVYDTYKASREAYDAVTTGKCRKW